MQKVWLRFALSSTRCVELKVWAGKKCGSDILNSTHCVEFKVWVGEHVAGIFLNSTRCVEFKA